MRKDKRNLKLGRELRDEGIRQVTVSNTEWIAKARAMAVRHCIKCGQVSADDLRNDELGLPPGHYNAWGAIFKDKQFKQVGYKQSSIPHMHATVIRIWELAER